MNYLIKFAFFSFFFHTLITKSLIFSCPYDAHFRRELSRERNKMCKKLFFKLYNLKSLSLMRHNWYMGIFRGVIGNCWSMKFVSNSISSFRCNWNFQAIDSNSIKADSHKIVFFILVTFFKIENCLFIHPC